MQRATADEIRKAEANPYIRVEVTFDSSFHKGQIKTNSEFLTRLKEEAAHLTTSWLGVYFRHVAEHLEFDISEGRVKATDVPTFIQRALYDGCGSCNPGGGNRGMVCNGVCEIC